MKRLIATLATVVCTLAALAVDGPRETRRRPPDRPTGDLPPGQSGPFGGYSNSPEARYNLEGTGAAVSDPGKSTSGGNAGNFGAASNPATGQAGKPQTNTGVPGTPSNP